jgi:serine/threonine protein kinase
VRIIDVFEENGTAYYVMEYAESGSLADKVKRQGYVPEPDAVRYIRQIADALGYIHMQKMNHLDVKPANIMLSEADDAILIDFGLSKQYDATTGNQTSTTPVGISDGYAPMEQYRPGGVGEFSPETDIYSLGATFFKLLTGVTPPSASDVYEDGVSVVELKAKGVSQSCIDVICKTMEGRKRDRLKNVAEFIGLLDEHTTIIEGNAKPLPPPPVSPRTLEFECRLYVNTSDARYGILTVDTQKAEFKTKGIMSFLQGGGHMRFPIRSIIGISLRKHYGMTLGSVMVLTILDEYGNVFELSGKGIYQESSNVKTLTDIAYTLELYRRLYWIYDTVQQGYFALEESESDILRLNELSVEHLAERVRGL